MSDATALQRRFRWDINTGTEEVPVWSQVPGVIEFNPAVTPTDQDDFDYDTDGWKGSTRTMRMWGLEAKISYKQDDATFVANATHTFLRAASNAIGASGVVHMRWYDRNGADEAYEGHGLITWAPDGGDAEQLNQVSITVAPSSTDPVLTSITNPLNTAPVPIISSLSPATGAAAGGDLVIITGAYFTGATDVDFGVTAADDFEVISANKIAVVTPAVAASTVDVVVTTPNGVNANTAADNYTFV
jgi:hypothetical protein